MTLTDLLAWAGRCASQQGRAKDETYRQLVSGLQALNLAPDAYERAVRQVCQALRY